jgi:alpha-1,6-mannosyltransferase
MLDARPNGWLARTVDNVSPLILLTAIGAVIVGLTLATPFAFERFGDNAFMALTIPAGLLTIAATAQAERTPTTRAAVRSAAFQ